MILCTMMETYIYSGDGHFWKPKGLRENSVYMEVADCIKILMHLMFSIYDYAPKLL